MAYGTWMAAPCSNVTPSGSGWTWLASASASVLDGTALLIAYAAGLALPFLAVALGADAVAQRLGWVGRHHQAVSRVTGFLLVAIGLLMITNLLGRLAQVTSPFGL